MKKILMMAFLLTLLAPLAKAQHISYRYYDDNDYRSAYDYQEVLDVLRKDGYTISTEQYATLKEEQTAHHYKTFSPYYDYVIVGISNDVNLSDIDLHIYDEDGDEYAKDDGPDRVAIVHIYTSSSEQMNVVIKNAGSDTPSDFFRLAYF